MRITIALLIAAVGAWLYFGDTKILKQYFGNPEVLEESEPEQDETLEEAEEPEVEKTEIGEIKIESPAPGQTPESPNVEETKRYENDERKKLLREQFERNTKHYENLKAQFESEIEYNKKGLREANNASPNFKGGRVKTSKADKDSFYRQKEENVRVWRSRLDESKAKMNHLEETWRGIKNKYREDMK